MMLCNVVGRYIHWQELQDYSVISDSSFEPNHYDDLKSHKVNEDMYIEESPLSSYLFSVYIYRVHPRCITV